MTKFHDWVKAEGLDPVLALEDEVYIDIQNDLFTLNGNLRYTLYIFEYQYLKKILPMYV